MFVACFRNMYLAIKDSLDYTMLKLRYRCVKSVQLRSYFWSVFTCIRTEYGDLRSISAYSLRIQENTDQKQLRIWTLFTQRYLFKLNNGNTRAMCEICLKLEIHQNDVTGLFPYPLKTSKCHQLGKF